jgi:transmembrane protein TMEM260 (protein O-mannosyltransferase)
MAFGDWGEMQTVPHLLGVAHPTGYPTYVLLGWFVQLVPLGSVAFRANLLSAVLVAAALATVVAILLRLGVRPSIAAAVVLTLGAVPTVWAAATVAEVNPLHLLFVALLLHRALVWEEGRQTRDLVLGALILGLALGNHLLIVFVAPFIGIFVLWVGRREIFSRPWILAPAVAAGLLGLSVYLYIPLAANGASPLKYNHPVTIDAVLWLVGGTQFRGQFGFLSGAGLTEFLDSLDDLWRLLVERATLVVPILGGLGLVVLLRRRPAFGLTCLGILLTNVYFWATYLHLEHYLLVPWLVLAIGAGVALQALAHWLAAASPLAAMQAQWPRERDAGMPRLRGSDAGGLIGVIAVVFAVGLAVTNWPAADRSTDHGGDVFVDTVLGALPPDAAILSEWDASTPLWHAQYVLGRRPDVLIVDDTNIVYDGWGTRERRIASLICERPVFIVRLKDEDLVTTRAAYRLEPFLTVMVGEGVATATASRPVFRVLPLDDAACADAG